MIASERFLLKPTSEIVGYGLSNKVAFLTDGRFSGGSHGFIIGHISPEAYERGPISQIRTGDKIMIDCDNNTINWEVNPFYWENSIREHFFKFYQPENSYLEKYRQLVKPAEEGCVTV